MGLADCSKGTGDPSAARQASPVSLQVAFCACTDPHGAAAAREGALHKRFFRPHTVWINVWDSKRLQISFLPCQGLMQSNSLHILQASWEPGRNLLLFSKCFWGIFPASTTLQLCILSTKSNTTTTPVQCRSYSHNSYTIFPFSQSMNLQKESKEIFRITLYLIYLQPRQSIFLGALVCYLYVINFQILKNFFF